MPSLLAESSSETNPKHHPEQIDHTVSLLEDSNETIQTVRQHVQKFRRAVQDNSVKPSGFNSNVITRARTARITTSPVSPKPLRDGYFILETPTSNDRKATLHGPVAARNSSEALDVHFRPLGTSAAQLGLILTNSSTGVSTTSAAGRFNKVYYQICHSKQLDHLLLQQHQCNMRYQQATCYTYRPEPPPPPPPPRKSNASSTTDSGPRPSFDFAIPGVWGLPGRR